MRTRQTDRRYGTGRRAADGPGRDVSATLHEWDRGARQLEDLARRTGTNIVALNPGRGLNIPDDTWYVMHPAIDATDVGTLRA